MAVPKLEALLESIGLAHGWTVPGCDAFKLRNPLLIRSFALPGKNEVDEQGRRIFGSMMSGYRAGLFDLQLKIEGKSRAKLKQDDPLSSLLAVYGIRESQIQDKVVRFLCAALRDESISISTPLSYFLG